ncbi:hypothetical protein D9M71_645310 [compost metagenome]
MPAFQAALIGCLIHGECLIHDTNFHLSQQAYAQLFSFLFYTLKRQLPLQKSNDGRQGGYLRFHQHGLEK